MSVAACNQDSPVGMNEACGNAMRDFGWGIQTVVGTGFSGQTTAPVPTTFSGMATTPYFVRGWSQTIFGIVTTSVGVLAHKGICKLRGKEGPSARDMLITIIAATVGIICWNYGQSIGVALGNILPNIDPTAAKWIGGMLFAPLLAGVLEGTIQFLVRYAAREKDHFHKKLFVKELGYNASMGALPGMTWQVVLFLLTTLFAAYGGPVPEWAQAVITAGSISLLVGLMNMLSARYIDKWMVEQREKLEDRHK